MQLPELNIGGLRARLPIIQGGMGVGISLGGLAGAVARAGGIGILSGVQMGFRDPEFETDTLGSNLRAMKAEIAKARRLAPGGILGINFMTIDGYYEEHVRHAVKCGIDLIISGAGLPLALPRLVEGSRTKIMPIVSSVRACRLVVTNWMKKHSRLPDGVVVEGPLAGGHLGFKLQELREGTAEQLENIVEEVVAYVRTLEEKYRVHIPVIAAGGLRNHQDIRRMLGLGAAGVQMGSVFVATEECDAARPFKEAYVAAAEEDIRIILSTTGFPARALDTPFLKRAYGEKGIPVGRCYRCIPSVCNPAQTPFCLSQALFQAANGQGGLIFCGGRVGEIAAITTVAEVMRELAGQPAPG